jgi:hypothetical protein
MNETPKDILSEEDKKFIIDNYQKMGPWQLATRLNIKTEGRKCPIISDFIEKSGLQPATNSQPVSADVKKEPDSVEKIVEDIKDSPVIVDAPIDSETYEKYSIEEFANILKGYNISVRSPLTEKEKKDIIFLINQTQTSRYLLTYRSYRKIKYKELFREEFIRALYGKGEMPQEEINDFIDVCHEIVMQADIKERVRELEKLSESASTNTQQKVGIAQVIIELNNQHSNSTKRASEIKKTLGANREQRLKDARPTGLSVMSLIEAFQDAEKRAALLKIQEKKDAAMKTTLDSLDELDELKALIMGISPDELLQGSL